MRGLLGSAREKGARKIEEIKEETRKGERNKVEETEEGRIFGKMVRRREEEEEGREKRRREGGELHIQLRKKRNEDEGKEGKRKRGKKVRELQG